VEENRPWHNAQYSVLVMDFLRGTIANKMEVEVDSSAEKVCQGTDDYAVSRSSLGSRDKPVTEFSEINRIHMLGQDTSKLSKLLGSRSV
jgi:hypothetical protein